jgi:uncharacterized OB-fold protein
MTQDSSRLLKREFESSFTFTRSTGPIVGRFLTELRDRKIFGIKGSDGRVLMPPLEYDPKTFAALDKFVEIEQTGTVQSWCWVKEPREKHLFDKPFAFALILLDGADTPMVHMVDASDESAMSTGMRVKVRWAKETKGSITDIECFELA